MTFRVGQKVVCVNANLDDGAIGDMVFSTSLREGSIYQVRWVGIWTDGLSVRLVGVKRNFPEPEYQDVPFCSWRFRPLIERKTKTGIEILRQIARDVTERKPIKEIV